MKLLYWLCLCFVGELAWTESTLQLVHVFFRHGSRTPEGKDMYPNDLYTIKDFLPMGFGQLTNMGKGQAYELGKVLRKRYGDFLGDLYTPEVLEMQSTDFDRTKMSALLVLAGLFPPAPSQQWNNEIAWNPIPITMDRDKYDYTLRRPIHYCPTYNRELENVYNSPDAQKLYKEHQDLFDYLTNNTGFQVNSLHEVFRIYQTLNAEETMNYTLPKWADSVYPDQIRAAAAQQCSLENYNDILKKLNGGRSLSRVIKNMENKVKNITPGRKIYLYSGHENNVINVMAALNLFKPHVPKYSAAFIIELFYSEHQNIHHVKVFYVRDILAEIEEQILEGCDKLCTLEKFLDLVSSRVPSNYTAECDSNIFLD